MQDLSARGVGLRVLIGQGAQIDTTTAAGRLVFGIFAALAEFDGLFAGGSPQAWIAGVLHRIPEHPSNPIDELLPWNCKLDKALSQAA